MNEKEARMARMARMYRAFLEMKAFEISDQVNGLVRHAITGEGERLSAREIRMSLYEDVDEFAGLYEEVLRNNDQRKNE